MKASQRLAALRDRHWHASINGGLSPSARKRHRKLSDRYHRETLRALAKEGR